MKKIATFRPILSAVLFFCVCQTAHAQETKWIFADSVEEPNCEYLLNRLDYLAIETRQRPEAVGHMVIRNGPDPVKNHFYRRYLYKYLTWYKLDKQRYIITSAKSSEKGSEKIRVDLWTSLEGIKTAPAAVPEEASLKLETPQDRVLFVDTSVEVVKIDGKITYIEDCGACCIETLDLGFLLQLLEANPEWHARVAIGGATRSRGRQVLRLIRTDLAEIQSAAAKRIRFSIGKRFYGLAGLPRNISSVKVELVRTR